MEQQLTALESALRDEVAAYTVLVNRLPFKIALIRKNRVNQLESLILKEEEELKCLSGLEVERTQAVGALLSFLPAGIEPNLTAILPHLPQAWRERLAPLGERLRHLIPQLQAGHETCTVLLRASLEYIDFTMQIVSRAVVNAQPAMYGDAAPEMEVASPSLLLDRRA